MSDLPTELPTTQAPDASPPVAGTLSKRVAELLATRDGGLVLLGVWLLGLGLFFRFKSFGFPNQMQFDEHHFVNAARTYLNGAADQNDHPPLGKLFMALSMHWLGDSSLAWRVPSSVFGCITVALAFVTARRLFPERWAPLLACSFVSVDGFLVSYARTALLDGALVAMALLSVLAATLPTLPLLVGVGGLAAGIAMATKFSGLGALLPPLVALTWSTQPRNRRLAAAAALGVIALSIYVACYSLGLKIAGQPADLGAVISETRRLVQHHAVLTDMTNSATSSWPTWILPTRPIVHSFLREHLAVRAMSSLGNLALWWGGCALGLASAFAMLWNGIGKSWRPEPAPVSPAARTAQQHLVDDFVISHGRACVLLLVGFLGFLLPWVLSRRDSYIYHFLPCYAVLQVLLGGFVSHAHEAKAKWVLPFLLLVTVVAGIYGPLACYLPLTDTAYQMRLFVGSWR
ncbi:MAG: glycosyltransferase family 39 protein [Polyangiaceae bacterium]